MLVFAVLHHLACPAVQNAGPFAVAWQSSHTCVVNSWLRALAIISALLSNLHAHSASLLVHSLTCLSNIGGGMLLHLYAPHPAHCTPSVPSVSCMPVVMTIKAMLQSGIVLFDIHHKFECHLYLKIRPTWSTRPLFLSLCTTIFLYGQRITEIIFGYSSASLSVYQDIVNDEGIVYSYIH